MLVLMVDELKIVDKFANGDEDGGGDGKPFKTLLSKLYMPEALLAL